MSSRRAPDPELFYRRAWDAPELCRNHPPRFVHGHKVAILERLCPSGAQVVGRIEVSRWGSAEWAGPVRAEGTVDIEARPGGFGYEPAPTGESHWWVNFAAGELFQHYAGRCFAQDEIQVFEHPVLASVREALLVEGMNVRVTDRGCPTPILVSGSHRRIEFDTRPRPEVGRHGWLYGRAFDAAPREVVLGAARPLEPPTVSDILVMEAPAHGWGRYTSEQIASCLSAAYSGFRAAALESARRHAGEPCVVHTGFWGCGAYGGNHVLMTAVQIVAARLAAIDRLVYYLWDSKGIDRFEAGRDIASRAMECASRSGLEAAATDLASRGFVWGSSDGN